MVSLAERGLDKPSSVGDCNHIHNIIDLISKLHHIDAVCSFNDNLQYCSESFRAWLTSSQNSQQRNAPIIGTHSAVRRHPHQAAVRMIIRTDIDSALCRQKINNQADASGQANNCMDLAPRPSILINCISACKQLK